MQLPVKTFSVYLRDMSAALQGATTQILDLSVGSVLRAILEANASVALWLQMLISDVMDASRAATARGSDLDSWMKDFSLLRLPATNAVGVAKFSRFSAIGSTAIAPGTKVRTSDGTLTFVVIEDTGHDLWDQARAVYAIPDSQQTAVLPIRAEATGVRGNVLAGSITLIASGVAGIDSVVNEHATTGGMDPEQDAQFRARFVDYINSRSKGTVAAISFAVESINQGLKFVVHENQDSTGAPRVGHFIVTVDDGTGDPTPDLVAQVAEAVDPVRPIGSTFSVHPPHVVQANISLSVTISSTGPTAANRIRAEVAAALETYVNALPIGAALSITRLAQVGYGASREITNISGIRVNGLDDDLVPDMRGVIKPGVIAVS